LSFCILFSSGTAFSLTVTTKTNVILFPSTPLRRDSLRCISTHRHTNNDKTYYHSKVVQTKVFLFDKIFEEEGILGRGITVGKIQVALNAQDRTSQNSIFTLLEGHAADDSDANEDLARMANDMCLGLMRRSDDWVAACSASKWFSSKDAGKAESYYNELSNSEAAKFEKVRRAGGGGGGIHYGKCGERKDYILKLCCD
jgi:hypothetical protein